MIPSMQLSRIREAWSEHFSAAHGWSRRGLSSSVTSSHSNYGAHVLPQQGSGYAHLCLILIVLCQ